MTLARSFALCLSFLVASTAAAQLVGPEVLSEPFTPQTPASLGNYSAVCMARIGQSAVLAWPIAAGISGSGRILLARLDGRLRAIANREVPALSAGANANSPSIATDGNNILVVWSESAANVAAALFDRDLNLLAGPRLLMAGDYRGHATNTGDTFLVVVNNVLFRFKSDTFSSPDRITTWQAPGLPAMDGVVFNGTFGVELMSISTAQVPVFGPCPPCVRFSCLAPPPCPTIGIADESTLFFHVLYRDPLTWKSAGAISFRAMASGPVDTAAIWRTDRADAGEILAATVIQGLPELPFPPPLVLDRMAGGEPGVASVAWDGERFAIVWQTWTSGDPSQRNHGIAFATIENGAIALQSILIDTPADELRPFIVALAPGHYIVGYEVVNGTEHRLGGRVVALQPSGRRRPADSDNEGGS